MPELPEVETIRIGLSSLLPGKHIKSITSDWEKSFPNAQQDVHQFLIGARVVRVTRRAKVLLIELSSKYSLVIHLKMTGQLVFRSSDDRLRFGAGHPSGSLVGELPDKSTRVTIELTEYVKGETFHSKLFFNDQRKFGWMRLLPTAEVMNIDFMQRLGPEPLSADFTQAAFRARFQRRANTNIKAALLDQSVIAGVGNIYADESLWRSRIHPATLIKNLSRTYLDTLYVELRAVLNLAIEKGGSSDRDYVNAEGQKGSYLSFAKVFRRNGQPCHRHPDTLIQKIRVAGRGTHICPKCQKEPEK